MQNFLVNLYPLLLILTLASCNLDVDTSDPMASETISDSQRDGFFIKKYRASSLDTSCKIKEAWIEYSWKNEVKGFRVYKERLPGFQLNLSVTSLPLNGNEYLFNWQMSDPTYGTFGTSNGCYVLHLHDEKVPDSFKINLYPIDLTTRRKDTQTVCTIFLSSR